MTQPVKRPKKLIEVALPLDDINAAAAREKSIRHGHPSTLHLWWARRPLAAARAVIFAQMVNDPGYQRELGRGVNKHEAEARRARLFAIIRDLVKWENTDNEEVLQRARDAIRESWRETCHLNRHHPQAATLYNPDELPGFHDPFAGGGALPLEAQRLGLAAHASDLNPVAVMINKAMIEIPPRFAGRAPVGPVPAAEKQTKLPHNWQGAQGLAEDVRRYGHWLRHEAEQRIGQYYPKIRITAELAAGRPDLKPLIGQELTVIAWLWARTVSSPNPAFAGCQVPLAASFVLSSKKGKEAWVAPQIDGKHYRFTVKTGTPPEEAKNGTKAARGANFICLMSGVPLDQKYIRKEFKEQRASTRLMAIVAEGKNGRVYLPPTEEIEQIALSTKPDWKPETEMNQESKDLLSGRGYGFRYWHELFTPRQLLALTTFSDLIDEARTKIAADYRAAHPASADDDTPLAAGGSGAQAYADAVVVYLSFIIDRLVDFNSKVCGWIPVVQATRNTFARQAIPMTWDYAELNPFSDWLANFSAAIEKIISPMNNAFPKVILNSPKGNNTFQADAQTQTISQDKIISTDPPYYDNIGYADLSDFFYVWLRRSLRPVYPQLFAAMAVPKAEELVATPYRHGGKEAAERFFLDGMSEAMHRLAVQAHPAFPVTIYYAFKQSETKDDATASTGWETFLQAVISAGFAITGTWPMRTELGNRMIGQGTNALASSVVLVCRPRAADAPTASRGDFLRELKAIMPEALETMLGSSGASPVAPVDLAQAAIGPGMEAFSRYAQVLESNGAAMGVREALVLINRAIDSYFEEEGAGDTDSGFCMAWFKQYGWSSASFGDADTLARAKGTAVASVERSGVLEAGGGKVRLRKWQEYADDWQPGRDDKTPVWEACHHLVRLLNQQGEHAAGTALAALRAQGDAIYRLAYQLYTLCERKKRAEDARYYNELIAAWPQISAAALEAQAQVKQPSLDL